MRISDWSSDVCSSDLFDSALSHVDRAIALAPDNSAFHVTRGGLLARHGGADAARGALQEAVNVDPNAFLAYVSLAHLAIARGDFGDAQQKTARAARIEDRKSTRLNSSH